MRITELSDQSLLASLDAACLQGCGVTARIVACLVEVEERRLHLEAACSSMFDFCVRKLKMSEGVAFRRINAARLVRRFPPLLDRIARGDVCLSTLVLLRPHLNAETFDSLLTATAGKTQKEVEVLLAQRAPKPDVPASIAELPREPVGGASPLPFAEAPHAAAPTPLSASAPTRVEPLSEAKFKVQLTASAELKAKLERAQDLMRHRNPSGDLVLVVEAAVDALLERLERERLAKASRPRRRSAARQAGRREGPGAGEKARAIPRSVRREVFERDGEQCTFVSKSGERCPATGFLELDHVEPRALGGSDDASNLRVMCHAHNLLRAEAVFGKAHVAQRIDFRQRKSRVGATDTTTPVFDRVVRGLAHLGFGTKEARRAMQVLATRHPDGLGRLEPELLVREALRVLT